MSDYQWLLLPPALGVDRSDLAQSVEDRMYRLIPITRFAKKLTQTSAVLRLHQVSHLGLKLGMVPYNVCATKYEHTLGMYNLVLEATKYPPLNQYRNLLIAAAFAHDIGSPCFTHSAEPAMHRVIGRDHESVVADTFRGSDFHKVLEGEGVDFDEVISLILGTHPNRMLAQLIHGTLDLDTLDGTCRYSLMWLPILGNLLYDPRILIDYFAIENGELVIRDRDDASCIAELQLYKFIIARRDVFSRIHGSEIEAPQAMLERALHFAVTKGELDAKFFWLSDEQAITFLTRSRRNRQTRRLILAACESQPYVRVSEYLWQAPTDDPLKRVAYMPLVPPRTHEIIRGVNARQEIADELSVRAGVPPEFICVSLGQQKICKNLNGLPLLTVDGRPIPIPRFGANPLFGNVYLHPDLACQAAIVQKVEEAFESLINPK